MLLNPEVNSVLIFLLTVFDSADGIGFPQHFVLRSGGLRVADTSGSLAEEEESWRFTRRFPAFQPGDRHASSPIVGQNQPSLCAQEEEIQWDLVDKARP